MVDTGKDLKKWRKENGLTQQQVADFSGYSKYSISHIESKNAPISKKLKGHILQENEKLNPPKPPLQEAIENFYTYNKERNNFYDKELKPLEKNLASILNNIPKEFDKTSDYLTLFNVWCSIFTTMVKTPYISQENYNHAVNQYLITLRTNTSQYVKNHGSKKEK